MVSTATIKLSKAEIDRVVRSLVVSIRISDVFDYNSEKANFTTLKDDFVKIKRMLDDGEYKAGKKEGQGIYTYSDGVEYVGGYKDDLENGQGTYTYPGGEKYVGEWKDGKFHGQGTLTYINGTVEKGIWKDGNIVESQ